MEIIVCDDDKKHVNECIRSLKKICNKNDIEADIRGALTYETVKKGLNKFKADLLILDINLEDADGIKAASELRKNGYQGDIIFYSRHEERMKEAFDVSALNFLVKDTTDENELERVFLRAADSFNDHNSKVILFRNGNEIVRVPMDDILYFEVNNRIITVYYGQDKSFEFYSTLAKIEAGLGQRDFVRCHRAYIVAPKHITRILKTESGHLELVMDNDATLPLGSKYREELDEALNSN